MGIFDLINSLQEMADNPELNKTAASMGKALQEMPQTLVEILGELKLMNTRLVEISLGLDTLSDPIKRPPFRAGDVEAAMQGAWPPMGNNLTKAD